MQIFYTRDGMCLKELEGGETGGVIPSPVLHVLSLSCPWNVQMVTYR